MGSQLGVSQSPNPLGGDGAFGGEGMAAFGIFDFTPAMPGGSTLSTPSFMAFGDSAGLNYVNTQQTAAQGNEPWLGSELTQEEVVALQQFWNPQQMSGWTVTYHTRTIAAIQVVQYLLLYLILFVLDAKLGLHQLHDNTSLTISFQSPCNFIRSNNATSSIATTTHVHNKNTSIVRIQLRNKLVAEQSWSLSTLKWITGQNVPLHKFLNGWFDFGGTARRMKTFA
jgi:hypothetical protein